MKVGAEPKRLGILAVLAVAAGYLVYKNVFSAGPASSPEPAPMAAPTAAPASADVPAAETRRTLPRSERRTAARASLQEFRPSLRPVRGETRDPAAIDPTLRLDLLARLQQVLVEGGQRTLFEFSAAPLPPTPEPKIIPKPGTGATSPANAGAAEEAKPAQTASSPPPPIPLKFFGYTTQARLGIKRAFFLDGDEILVASEGDVLKKRYRVVRVGLNSVVVEDMEHKHEQTLPLEPQAA